MTDMADGAHEDRAEDPLARLERLVNARTSRMMRDTDERRRTHADVPPPADVPSPGQALHEPVPAAAEPVGAFASAEAIEDDLAMGLDAGLAAILDESIAQPADDLQASVHVDASDAPPADLSSLLPSLAALRGGFAEDAAPSPVVAAPVERAPLVDDPSMLEGFENEMNGAVEQALAAAHAAMAATGAAPIADEVPEATHPLALPDLPAFEAEMRDFAAESDELSDFERELAQEMLTLDEPIDDGVDQLAAQPLPLVADGAADLASPADFERFVAQTANDNGARRRGAMIAAVIGGLAVIGGGSSMLLGGVATDPTEVAVIRAEAAPYKVAPASPGGRQVPNQDNPVYQNVAGVETAKAKADPTVLVSKSEDVSDVRVVSSTSRPNGSAKGIERLDGVATAIDVSPGASGAVAPRRVRTLKVGPDGSILREPGTVPVAAETAAPTAQAPVEIAAREIAAEPVVENAAGELAGEPAPSIPVPLTRGTAPAQAPTVQVAAPVEAAVNPVAAVAERAAPKVTPGGYVVQIASVPSADAARRTYADLASRYASIIGGRGVDYQVAEIDGRGTFHRVRVPAPSKAEAGQLCSALKAAGGSCFVTR